jgi:hypothetical protein
MINSLIVVCDVLFNNFGLAIMALTIIVNGLMLPLTLKQVRASKAMQELQPFANANSDARLDSTLSINNAGFSRYPGEPAWSIWVPLFLANSIYHAALTE